MFYTTYRATHTRFGKEAFKRLISIINNKIVDSRETFKPFKIKAMFKDLVFYAIELDANLTDEMNTFINKFYHISDNVNFFDLHDNTIFYVNDCHEAYVLPHLTNRALCDRESGCEESVIIDHFNGVIMGHHNGIIERERLFMEKENYCQTERYCYFYSFSGGYIQFVIYPRGYKIDDVELSNILLTT